MGTSFDPESSSRKHAAEPDAGLDPERRQFARGLLGILGAGVGASMLSACDADGSGLAAAAPAVSSRTAALTASNVIWLDTIGTQPVSGSNGNLRGNPGSETTLVAVVLGYHASGDGGGGIFVWNPNAGWDNGGTVICPNQDLVADPTQTPVGPAAHWKRVFSGALNSAWFGVVGRYSAGQPYTERDDFGLQRALTTAYNSGDDFSSRTVFVPAGRYRIGRTLEMLPRTSLVGVPSATVLIGDAGVDIVRVEAIQNNLEGLAFQGGRVHVALYGAFAIYGGTAGLTSGTTVMMRQIRFIEPTGPAIMVDITSSTEERGGTAALMVHQFDFTGQCLYFGSLDFAAFSQGNVVFSDMGAKDTTGLPLAVFMAGGALRVSDVMMSLGSAASYDKDHRWAVFDGSGHLVVERVRFPGELRMLCFRARGTWSRKIAYSYKSSLNKIGDDFSSHGTAIVCRGSAMSSAQASINWLEIHDRLPVLVSIEDGMPVPGGTGGQFSSLPAKGIWIDSDSITLSELTNGRSSTDCQFRFAGFFSPDALRIKYGSDPLDLNAMDVTPLFRPNLNGVPVPETRSDRRNLWTPTIISISDGASGGVIGSWTVGSIDTSLGDRYPIPTVVAGSDGSLMYQKLATPTFAGWGPGYPAGEYVFSAFVKETAPAGLALGGGAVRIAEVNVSQQTRVAFQSSTPGTWRRIWLPFFHDGARTHVFVIELVDFLAGQGAAIGCFAVERGTIPSETPKFPGNTPDENRLHAVYYFPNLANSGPTAGTYNTGDVAWNSTPTAGGVMGAVCISGGTPGTWRPFAMVS